MKKSRKRNAIVLALIVLLIATAIGYAAFASSLEITGNATANGSWDLHFANASISKSETGNSVTLSGGADSTTGDSLDVQVLLTYPGDTATVTVDVVNNGSCAANLKTFSIDDISDDVSGNQLPATGGVWTDEALQIQLNPANFTQGTTTIASGASQTYTMVFTWNPEVNESQNVTANFTISMDFEQPTV